MNLKIVIVTVAGAAVLTGAALAQSTGMSPTGSGAMAHDPPAARSSPGAYSSGRPVSSNTGGFAVDTGSGSIPGETDRETMMAGERG
jgi:hypothetical protein